MNNVDLNFLAKMTNGLNLEGVHIHTWALPTEDVMVGHLIRRTRKELLARLDFGRTSLKRLEALLDKHGLKLGMDLPEEVFEIKELDLRRIAIDLAKAAKQDSGSVSVRVLLPLAQSHPVYNGHIEAHVGMESLFNSKGKIRVRFDPAGGRWCDAEIVYRHYLQGCGYLQLDKVKK